MVETRGRKQEARRPAGGKKTISRGDLLDSKVPRVPPEPLRRPAIERPVEKLLLAALHCLFVACIVGIESARIQGVAGFVALLGLVGAFHWFFARHLVQSEPAFVASTRRQAGLYATVLLTLVVGRALMGAADPNSPWLVFLIPLAFVTLVARIVQSQRFAIECTVYSGALLGLLLHALAFPAERVLPLLTVLFAGSVVAGIATDVIRKRSKLIKVGALVAVTQAGTLLALQAIDGQYDRTALFFAALQGLALGYIVSGSLPFIELLFNVLTDISLLELCNQNDQPLLKKLLLVAPGTHHHSFVVGVLAEAAAPSVGANPLLCRAGAYYHDIGKMVKPEYFAENQDQGVSPHDAIEPAMSFLIICAHTKDGLEIGRRYGLHPSILEFIPTHHGTSLVRFFYHKATKAHPDEEVPESAYRYPGPRPRSKETGLVNVADAVEAATRSLDDPSPARLRAKVHEIIHQRMIDRQLDETGLTFADLERIEEAFVRVLVGIHHARPKYPELEKKARAG